MISRFDEKKLAVGVASADDQTVDLPRKVHQQRNDEPLVLDVVAEVRDAVEMGGKLL